MPPSAPRAHNTRPIARYVGAAVPELGPGASYETTSDREVTLFEDFLLLSSPGPSSITHGRSVYDLRTIYFITKFRSNVPVSPKTMFLDISMGYRLLH